MNFSTSNNTSSKQFKVVVSLSFIRFGGHAMTLQFHGKQPTWHTMIFFGGLASLVRVILAIFGETNDLSVVIPAYVACVLAAFVVSAVIRQRGDRASRLFSGNLGKIAFDLANVAPFLCATPLLTGHTSLWAMVVPVAASSLVWLFHAIGEALVKHCPAP